MGDIVIFTVMGEPQGKGRPRFGTRYSAAAGRAFVNVRTPDKTVAYENLVKLEYQIQTKNYRFPDDAQLEMTIVAGYGIPKNASKKKRASMISGEIRPTKKPDMDNVMKIIADSLNQIAYRDDTQIVDATCIKFYTNEPRVMVIIRRVPRTESVCVGCFGAAMNDCAACSRVGDIRIATGGEDGE